jgi:hypothetical protein
MSGVTAVVEDEGDPLQELQRIPWLGLNGKCCLYQVKILAPYKRVWILRCFSNRSWKAAATNAPNIRPGTVETYTTRLVTLDKWVTSHTFVCPRHFSAICMESTTTWHEYYRLNNTQLFLGELATSGESR